MAENSRAVIPGTTISRRGRAALIRGSPGSGKSDLALRALTLPLQLPGETDAVTFEFVSDDQTVIERRSGGLLVSAPETIAGLIEVRGVGIIDWPHRDNVPLQLVADTGAQTIRRLPEAAQTHCQLLEVVVDRIDISAVETSAVVKLAIALAGSRRRLADC